MTEEQQQPMTMLHLSTAQKNLIAGGIGGSTGKTFTAPLSRLTVLYQVSPLLSSPSVSHTHGRPGGPLQINAQDSFLATCQNVVRQEGILSLWKGNFTSVIHRFPYSAINFAVYEMMTKAISSAPPGHESSATRFTCGSVAGAAACIACYPLDLVRTRLTVSDSFDSTRTSSSLKHGSNSAGGGSGGGGSRIIHTVRQIVREEGALGLYQGLNISLLVTVPTLAIGFTAYGFMKELLLSDQVTSSFPQGSIMRRLAAALHKDVSIHTVHNSSGIECVRQLSAAGSLLSGCVSGLASSILIFPADVVRKRMQVAGQTTFSHAIMASGVDDSPVAGSRSETSSSKGSGSNRSNGNISISNGSGSGRSSTTMSSAESISNSGRTVPSSSSAAAARGNRLSALQHCGIILRRDGPAGFYRGIVPELLKVCPMVAVTFCTYEMAQLYLNDRFPT